MINFEAFLKDSNRLSERVDSYSRGLNGQSEELNGLITRLESLFEMIARSDNLIKIVRDYSAGFKEDILTFKNDLIEQDQNVRFMTARLNAVSDQLGNMNVIFQEVLQDSDRFLVSAQNLAYLAKNTEIRAYQARADGRGLSVIARETLVLARKAQVPFRELSQRLGNLKETAQPVVQELEEVRKMSSRAENILMRTFESLQMVDENLSILQKIMNQVENNQAAYNQLQKTISGDIAVLNERLIETLQIIEDLLLRSSEIRSLAHILRNLSQSAHLNFAQEMQLRFLTDKCQKILAGFPAGREAPLFSDSIQKSIAEIVKRINELGGVLTEMARYDTNLDTGMTNIAELKAQVENFDRDRRKVFQRLNAISSRLAGECAKMEQLHNQAQKVLSRIKTLTVFARIEEGRCPVQHRPVIAPVVAEFFQLAQETERALENIGPRVTRLLSILQELKRNTELEREKALKVLDYGKIKLYFHDIVRVAREEITLAAAITQQSDRLTAGNPALYRHWQNFEDALKRVLRFQAAFGEMIKSPINAPVAVGVPVKITTLLTGDPMTLCPDLRTDSISHYILMNISNGLFEFGMEADPLPALCEEYEISPNSTQYTFRLRDGLKFANGQKLKIEDVKEGLLRGLTGPNAHLFEMIRGSREARAGKNLEAVAVRIVNNRTMQIELEYPFLPMLANLATNVADPYLPGDLPVGLGPFQITDWQRGTEVQLAANQHYFEGRPAVDEVRFKIIDDDAVAYEQFQKGALDIYKPGAISLARAREEFPRQLQALPELSVHFLAVNCRRPPFDNKHVRRALAYAIDTQRLAEDCLSGNAIPARGIFPPTIKAFNPRSSGYPFSISQARAELAEAGFPGGLPDVYPLEVSEARASIRLAEFIKQSLAEIGIRVEIMPQPWSVVIDRSYRGQHTLTISGWISDNGDPDNLLYPLFHSRSFGPTGNTFFYAESRVDEELDNARRIRNANQRLAAYRRIEEHVMADAPGVFLYHSLQYFLIQDWIKGFNLHPLGLIRFKYVNRSTFRPGAMSAAASSLVCVEA